MVSISLKSIFYCIISKLYEKPTYRLHQRQKYNRLFIIDRDKSKHNFSPSPSKRHLSLKL